jgi:hypothetical protein
MYETLFALAGLAMVGWLLLILAPGWSFTRRVAETAVFPIYLSVLYLVGITAVIAGNGVGFMADFGSAEGVLALLATGPVALIAWIHILAFDQVVAHLIYRDNLKHRVVPLPVQSVILVATLMLGPVGFLAYWGIRSARLRSASAAWGERHQAPPRAVREAAPAPLFGSVVSGATPLAMVSGLLRRERALVAVGLGGFALAGITALVAAVNGGWLLGTEGRLLEAVKFNVAIGIYTLALAMIVPFAAFSERGRRRWVGWVVGLSIFNYGMENVQAWRGLNPRFSAIAGPADQILGGVFFLSALGVMVLFIVLMRTFFRPDALADHPPLRLALRYATGGAAVAYGVGITMSVWSSGRVAGAGDQMIAHAAGFHALQAVPLVALLLGASLLPEAQSRFWTQLAGAGWLLFCLGLAVQAVTGYAPTAPTPALGMSAAGALAWLAALGMAVRVRFARVPAAA